MPLASGALVLAVGVALAVSGGSVLPVGPIRGMVLFGAAAVAAVIAVTDLIQRSLSDTSVTALPEATDQTRGRTPGDALDERLAAVSAGDHREKRQIRARVEDAGVAVLARRQNCTEAEAREQLQSGAWTDDTRAATLFVEDAQPSLSDRVRTLVTGESAFAIQVARATRKLQDLRGGDQ